MVGLMARLAIPVNLSVPPEPTKNMAKSFKGVNDYVTGVNVQCHLCKARGRVKSKLLRKGQKFVCGACR